MEDIKIDPQEAFQSLQRFTANEVSRLYGEIAARDTFIEQLLKKIEVLESTKTTEKNNSDG